MSIDTMRTWKIGDVEITRIVEVNNWEDDITMLLPDATPQTVLAYPWLQPHYATPQGKMIISFQCFVMRTRKHRIMLDTCIGSDRKREFDIFTNMRSDFLADLEHAGFRPEEIDFVLCTHLHFDHVGWNTRLVDGCWIPTFPNARYLFARTEWEHWSREPVDPGDDILGDSVRPILDAGLADLVECDHRVSPSVRLEPTPGHTPGHVCVRIESRGARAVITGDLMHHPLQIADPQIGATFDSDAAAARATRHAFVAGQADADVLVLGTHFATPTGGRIVGQGGARRFVPDAGA
jgi:glyoxylase-like metal-dependent hydrolase (beta-lactamase superfamily II)